MLHRRSPKNDRRSSGRALGWGVAATNGRHAPDSEVDAAACSTAAATDSNATTVAGVEMPASIRATMPRSRSASVNAV